MVDLTSTSSSWLCDFVMGDLDLYLSDYDTRRSFFRRRGVDYHNYSNWSKNPISDFKNSTVSISTQVTSTAAVKARVCVCVYADVCMWVRTHLSPAESTVTCTAVSNLCTRAADTVAGAEMASSLSTNPRVLPSHTSFPRRHFPPQAWFIRPLSSRQKCLGTCAEPEID